MINIPNFQIERYNHTSENSERPLAELSVSEQPRFKALYLPYQSKKFFKAVHGRTATPLETLRTRLASDKIILCDASRGKSTEREGFLIAALSGVLSKLSIMISISWLDQCRKFC